MFKKYDKSLRLAYPVLYAFTGLSAVGVFILGVVYIVHSNPLYGLAILLSGFASVIFMFTIVHVFLDHCMDSKLIRDKLYEKSSGGAAAKIESKTPVNGALSENAQPQTDIAAVAKAEHIRGLEQLYANGLLTQAEFEALKFKADIDFKAVDTDSVDTLSS